MTRTGVEIESRPGIGTEKEAEGPAGPVDPVAAPEDRRGVHPGGKAIDSETLDPVMVYRKFAEPDSVWWVRRASEFTDGRFKEVDVFEDIKYGGGV